MKKLILMAVMAAMVAMPVVSAEKARGGLIGGIYGCCFGLRGAAAYNDGKDVVAMEWVNLIIPFHLWSVIKGWQGTTTEDLRKDYGERFF